MGRLEVQKLTAKRDITEAIRSGLTLIKMDNLSITTEMLNQPIGKSNKYSPLWVNVLRGVFFDETENYDLPRIDWDDVDHYVHRIVEDGIVIFSETDDVVTIYDIESDLVNWSDIIDTIGNIIDIYIPTHNDLNYVYDRVVGLEDILNDLDVHASDIPLLMDEIINDEDYRFVYELIAYNS